MFKATSQDLYDAVNDPYYQSIVVMGHEGRQGKFNWVARDGLVTAEMVEAKWNGVQKNGYWFHYTCGVKGGGVPLGYNVMKDKSKILGYERRIRQLGMYLCKPTVIGLKNKPAD